MPAPTDYDLDKDGRVISDDDIAGYSRPETGNLLLIGSQDPECDPLEVEDPDQFNRDVTDEQWRAQVLRQAQRIPSLPIPGQAMGVVDLYDVSDDWIPIYDNRISRVSTWRHRHQRLTTRTDRWPDCSWQSSSMLANRDRITMPTRSECVPDYRLRTGTPVLFEEPDIVEGSSFSFSAKARQKKAARRRPF